MENIVLTTFMTPETADEAMSELRLLHDSGHVDVRSAVVLERQPDGLFTIRRGTAGAADAAATAAGGVVGALIGALASPAGLLLGGIAGALLGSVVDEERSEADEEMLVELAGRVVPPGSVALLADVSEPRPELVDVLVARLGGALWRRPRAEVEQELAAMTAAERRA